MRRLIKRRIKQALESRGFRLRRAPKVFAEKPEAELGLSFEMVVHHHLASMDDPRELFFVQIGAFDGVTNDPIHPFVRRYGWKGILVEPQGDVFQALVANYADQPQLVLENVAIAQEDGEQEIFLLGGATEGASDWRKQQTSFRRDVLLRFRRKLPDVENLIRAETVRCLSWNSLLAKHAVDRVDLLQIDAEGFDFEILRMVDLENQRPAIIHYEHQHLRADEREESWAYLAGHGYRVMTESSVDTLAYRPPDLNAPGSGSRGGG